MMRQSPKASLGYWNAYHMRNQPHGCEEAREENFRQEISRAKTLRQERPWNALAIIWGQCGPQDNSQIMQIWRQKLG